MSGESHTVYRATSSVVRVTRVGRGSLVDDLIISVVERLPEWILTAASDRSRAVGELQLQCPDLVEVLIQCELVVDRELRSKRLRVLEDEVEDTFFVLIF